MRIRICEHADGSSSLFMMFHHLVMDLWSLVIVMQDLGFLYKGAKEGKPVALPPLPASYVDFVRWQSALLTSQSGSRMWEFWQRELTGYLPALELPVDMTRPAVQSYRSALHPFHIDADLVAAAQQLARSEQCTVFAVMLATYFTLLFRYSGQTDILVGVPQRAATAASLKTWSATLSTCLLCAPT